MTERPFDGEGVAPDQSGATPGPEGQEPDVVEEVADDDLNTEAVNDEPTDPFGAGEAEAIAAEHAAAAGKGSGQHPDSAIAAERLGDLQRLQAEYVNYKRRVDRDRALVQELAVQSVLDALLPVLDDLHLAREHGDLVGGPFAAIADKLESTLAKFGLERFGEAGAEFDPTIHEALMHTAWDPSNPALPTDATATTVVSVLQPGYRSGDRVIRPARVSVADPE